VSVTSVDVIKVEAANPSSEVTVNTILMWDLAEKAWGDFIHTTMPDLRDRKKPRGYYVPLSIDQERTDVYRPSAFTVVPRKNTFMIEVDGTSILFAGDRG
jgi:hypothetical protein